MRSRNYYCWEFQKFRSQEVWEKYRAHRNEVNLKVRQAKVTHFHYLFHHLIFHLHQFSFLWAEEGGYPEEVWTSLDTGKATGPDRISARLLRMVAPSISCSLTKLLNESVLSEQIPSQLKEANITTIPKSGGKATSVTSDHLCSTCHSQLFEFCHQALLWIYGV